MRRERRRPDRDRAADAASPDGADDLVHDDAEGCEARYQRGEQPPRPELGKQPENHGCVEHPAGMVGRPQYLEQDIHDDSAEGNAPEAARAPEDHHGVDRDQKRERERVREHTLVVGAVHGTGEPGDAGSHRDGEETEPLDRDSHHLRREWVFTERTPGAPGAGPVDVVEQDRDDGDAGGRDEDVIGWRVAQHVPEDPEPVDVVDARRPARDVVRSGETEPVPRVAVGREVVEDLEEEEHDDREVVAAQPPRRESEDEAEQDRGRDDDRHGLPGRPVEVVVGRRQLGEEIGREAVEDDVAEVEDAGPADRDVQAHGEQDVEQRVGVDADHIPARAELGNRARDSYERSEQDDARRPVRQAEQTAGACGALARAAHPLVDADLR